MITRKEQEIINLLPKLCDEDTCRQVILMVDELSTLRDKIEKIEQIIKQVESLHPEVAIGDREGIRKIREVLNG